MAPGPLTWASVVQTTHCILRDLPKDGSQLGPKSDIPGIRRVLAAGRAGHPHAVLRLSTRLIWACSKPVQDTPGQNVRRREEMALPPEPRVRFLCQQLTKKGIKSGRRFLGL